MECYSYLRNVQDLLSDGKTPCERRFGQPFKGPIIPFGSLVEYHPLTAKDKSRIHQFGKKVLPGLFLGYALYAGWIWKGDVLVADLEELETVDASEIYSKRRNAKEVIFPKERGEFIFPIADGRIKTLGGDQDLRTSTLIRHRPIRGESNIDFLVESEGSLPQPHDSFPDAGEAINDFWSMSGSFIYRHHVEPRVKLYSPRDESFPIPLKYIDVSRTTHTNFDVKQEKRIDDYWNIDGSRDLSDSWTGFTQFTPLDEKPPDGYTWSGGRLTRKQLTSRPDHLWPELWKSMGKHAKLKEKQKWSEEKPHLENARKLRWIYLIDPEDKEFKETIENARKILEAPMAPAMPCKIRKNNKNCENVKNPIKSKQNLCVFWKLLNLQDCVWENHCRLIMKTILQEKETERNKTLIRCGKLLNQEVDLGEPTSFLDHVYLGCTQRQCEIRKNTVDNYRTMFESRISAGGV